MKSIKVYHYDAFSTKPNKGNPAGVVLVGEDLTEKEMQEIAKQVGFNETAFPIKSEVADIRIRYFTPGHEVNLCGHATMATIYALKTKGLLGDKKEITIETKAGILPIKIAGTGEALSITMKQASPQFEAFNGSTSELAHALGLEIEDIDSDYPVLYGSTGIWTLLVPIKKLSAFKQMEPHSSCFPTILKEMPKASVHPFGLETYNSEAHMHARHFSSPFSGTIEDPVTGTASGVMGAYYGIYIKKDNDPSVELIIEQGNEIGKEGKVKVSVSNKKEVEITGNAVYVSEFDVEIGDGQ